MKEEYIIEFRVCHKVGSVEDWSEHMTSTTILITDNNRRNFKSLMNMASEMAEDALDVPKE